MTLVVLALARGWIIAEDLPIAGAGALVAITGGVVTLTTLFVRGMFQSGDRVDEAHAYTFALLEKQAKDSDLERISERERYERLLTELSERLEARIARKDQDIAARDSRIEQLENELRMFR